MKRAICCICGKKVAEKLHPKTGEMYWNQGEDAYPVADGRCCIPCNNNIVVPARLEKYYQKQEHH